jgi:hypothetical protein
MKKILVILVALAIGPTLAWADSVATFANTTTGAGKLLATTSAAPAIATKGSCAGPGVVITKMYISSVTASEGVTVALWDAVDGLTESAKSRKLGTFNVLTNTVGIAGTLQLDFTNGGSSSETNGLEIKNYPLLVCLGSVSASATVLYKPGFNSRTRP